MEVYQSCLLFEATETSRTTIHRLRLRLVVLLGSTYSCRRASGSVNFRFFHLFEVVMLLDLLMFPQFMTLLSFPFASTPDSHLLKGNFRNLVLGF